MAATFLERKPGQKEFAPMPADGSEPVTNPPPLRWLSHPGIMRWRILLRGPGGQKLEHGPLRDPILALRKKLAPGKWTWQALGLDSSGKVVGRTAKRSFLVKPGLAGYAAPDTRKLERKLRTLRPRIFGKRIAEVKKHLKGEFTPAYTRLQQWCRLAEKQAPINEPKDFRWFGPDTVEHNEDWWRILSAGKIGSGHATRFALSFLLSGNRKHLALAKRWAMNLLAWDPWGPTSLRINDEAGMPMLERLAMVYDWLHPHWTDFERQRYLEVMLIRGEESRELNRQVDLAGKPFDNHQCRTIAFTGMAGLAFLGEIPQASEWLQAVLDILAVSYPSGSWGSDDGGWSQGTSYWAAYMTWMVGFTVAAGELGIKLAAAPYYRNTGYFPLYNLPPYAPRGGFGDHSEGGPAFNHKLVVGAFGTAAGDGYLRSYSDAIDIDWQSPSSLLNDPAPKDNARRWDAWAMQEVQSLLLSPAPGLKPKDISELPAAREFPYIGWAAMHSKLGDAQRDTWLQFKSGPFGSVSHSHADQNSINVFAHGEALLIDSGYYPWYGSIHDVLWTRQTWAHNTMLVDGHGQPPFDWFARGKIEGFAEQFPFAYARGEAAPAYNRPPEKEASEMARKHAPALLKKMGPATKVKQASRSVLMVAGEQPYYLILDWLETADPAKFQWLAHAHQKMRIVSGGFKISSEDARLAATFVAPVALTISQHNDFTYPPEARCSREPKQWHLQAETSKRARKCRLATVLVPHRKGKKPLTVRAIPDKGAIVAAVGGDILLAPTEGTIANLAVGNLKAKAAAIIVGPETLFVAEATKLVIAGHRLHRSSEPQSITIPRPVDLLL
jgi:Heparinase II/III-like protein/Domain of unknown function (DUF4962)